MGVHPEGHLNVPGGTFSAPASSTYVVGLRYIPTNGEATAPGCLCEGWGVADADGSISAYANEDWGGPVNLVVQAGTGPYGSGQLLSESVSTSFLSITSAVGTGGKALRITHDFKPSASNNLYEVIVTIENTGTAAIGDLRYRRVMDWDIPPTTFYEWVEIHVGTSANLVGATTDGFRSGDPLSTPGPLVGSPPTTLVSGSPDYFGGPADQGALFDFAFGGLAVGASKTFRIYYGAAASRTQALAALASVGAEMYSLGFATQVDGSAAVDGPNVFIFGFKGVGGTPIGSGRMTGGGSVGNTGVRHGFELRCDASAPNNLEVNWGRGNRFHLESLTSIACSDDSAIAPNPRSANFDTIAGGGTGRCNGVAGATVKFKFTDAGEPGRNDSASIEITGCPGGNNINVNGNLNNGNHQAHAP